jgi:predicted RNase H-like HicB family nuclease
MNEEDKVDYDALATTLGVDPREAERMYDAFQAMKNEGNEVEAKISINEAEGGNDWWVKADEELGLDFDGEDLEDLAINADESWQADFAQQVLDIDASDYEDYKNQVSAIYDETNPF